MSNAWQSISVVHGSTNTVEEDVIPRGTSKPLIPRLHEIYFNEIALLASPVLSHLVIQAKTIRNISRSGDGRSPTKTIYAHHFV